MGYDHSSLSFLRTIAFDKGSNIGYMPLALRAFHATKNFPAFFLSRYPDIGGKMLAQLLLRNYSQFQDEAARLVVRQSATPIDANLPIKTYDGTPAQNVIIDRSLTLLNGDGERADFVGEGAAGRLHLPRLLIGHLNIKETPIAIVGMGAAGILIWAALREVGFNKIRMFDKRGATLGIWGQPNVRGGTKNNPRNLSFNGRFSLNAAQGNGTKDGEAVAQFLTAHTNHFGASLGGKKLVKRISAGELNHTLYFDDGEIETFPIVINCMGTGKPRELYDPERMRLRVDSQRVQAVRWQKHDLKRDDVQGHSFTFIGLGNSTAEMLSQLHRLQDEGAECDYRVMTHYPRDAVHNPSDAVHVQGKVYRVFRDLNKPDLTSFQGDLQQSRNDYHRALLNNKIIHDVTSWGQDGPRIHYTARGTRRDGTIPSHNLYALCGYAQTREDLDIMDIPYNEDTECPESDYDGEFRNRYQRFDGYFGLGALMDAPHNRNAAVIPGMMFRIPDMVYSIIMRAVQHTKEVHLAS